MENQNEIKVTPNEIVSNPNEIRIMLREEHTDTESPMEFYTCGHCLKETIEARDKIIQAEKKYRMPFKVACFSETYGDEVHIFLFDNPENTELILDFSEYGNYQIESIKIHNRRKVECVLVKNAQLCKQYHLDNTEVIAKYENNE
jgi:hypothetical protein